MGVKFIVKQEDNEKEINLDSTNTVADLKTKIIEEFQLKCKCLDIYLQLEWMFIQWINLMLKIKLYY